MTNIGRWGIIGEIFVEGEIIAKPDARQDRCIRDIDGAAGGSVLGFRAGLYQVSDGVFRRLESEFLAVRNGTSVLAAVFIYCDAPRPGFATSVEMGLDSGYRQRRDAVLLGMDVLFYRTGTWEPHLAVKSDLDDDVFAYIFCG